MSKLKCFIELQIKHYKETGSHTTYIPLPLDCAVGAEQVLARNT